MSLIGLDIGTTGCKAIVFDAQGARARAGGARVCRVDASPSLGRAERRAGVAVGLGVAPGGGRPGGCAPRSACGSGPVGAGRSGPPGGRRGAGPAPGDPGHGHAHRGGERVAGRALWRGIPVSENGDAAAHDQHPAQAALAAAQRAGAVVERRAVPAVRGFSAAAAGRASDDRPLPGLADADVRPRGRGLGGRPPGGVRHRRRAPGAAGPGRGRRGGRDARRSGSARWGWRARCCWSAAGTTRPARRWAAG